MQACRIRFGHAALAMACLFPTAALASDEAAIVVTGTRFSGGVGRAIGATVITAEDITRSTASTVGEVLERLGGVTVRRNLLGTQDPNLDLRGFGVTGDQNTLVLVDGQRLSENELVGARISTIPLAAIERIEILRGGGAVLHGGGATGGTINIVTRTPGEGSGTAYLGVTLGGYRSGELRGGLDAAGPLVGLTLHASQRESDNYRANNATRSTVASGEGRLRVEGGFVALRFAADRQDARLPGARSETQLATDPRGTSTPNDFARMNGDRLALAAEKRVGEWTLAADVGRRAKDANAAFDAVAGAGTYMRNTVHAEEDALSPRLRWQRKFGGAGNALTMGYDRRDHRYSNDGRTDFGFGPSRTDTRAAHKGSAFYLQDQLSLPSATRLSLGARRETLDQEWRELVAPLATRTLSRTLTATELAVQQDFGPGLAAHVRGGRGFRVATVDENNCFFAPCSPLLEPQTSREAEAGLEWKAERHRLRATWFDIRVDNEIYYNNLNFTNMNMPPLRRQGVELGGRWRPHDRIDIDAHYSGVEATFERGSFGGIDVSGKTVPVVPRHQASLQLGWEFVPDGRLTLSHRYVGERQYDNDPANRFRRMPAHGITDLKMTYPYREVIFSGGINNLADKTYYAYALVNSSTAPTTFNAYPEARRMAWVGAEIRFK